VADVNVTVIGYVGNDPILKKSKSDLSWTQFRVGSTRSWRDTESGQWMDGPTMWFTVKVWGSKAQNVMDSIRKGIPVVVAGRLSAEPYVVTKAGESGEVITEHRVGLTIENAVVAIDLSRGAARYFRTDRDLPDPSDAPHWLRAAAANEPLPDGNVDVSEEWVGNSLESLEDELVAA